MIWQDKYRWTHTYGGETGLDPAEAAKIVEDCRDEQKARTEDRSLKKVGIMIEVVAALAGPAEAIDICSGGNRAAIDGGSLD